MRTGLMTTALFAIATMAAHAQQTAAVRVTNSHLEVTCVNGKTSNQRKWNPTAPASLTLTMRNEPRSGVANVPSGVAVITFTPEEGHRYEVEVHASVTANSQRVWPSGEWTPVVRDRTTDRIVSGEPQWQDLPGCASR